MSKPRLKTAYLDGLFEYEKGGYVVDLKFNRSEILYLAAAILNTVNEGHETFTVHVQRKGVKKYPEGSVFVEGR